MGVKLQWCDTACGDTFTADHEPLLGCCTDGPSEVLACLPVADRKWIRKQMETAMRI